MRFFADRQDYCIHYLQSVPQQVQNESSILPSLISYNAIALHSHPMSILDQINWLNKQHSDKIDEINVSSDVNVLNRVPVKDSALPSLPSEVCLRKEIDISIRISVPRYLLLYYDYVHIYRNLG